MHGPWAFYGEPGGLDPEGAVPPKQWGVAGIIARIQSRKQADLLLETGVPVVDLAYALPDLLPYGISNDRAAIGRLAAEHLLNCGLRRFAYCGFAGADEGTAKAWETARCEGFRDGLADVDYEFHEYTAPTRKADHAWEREREHLAKWLESLPKPIGVFAANDYRGRQVLEAAELAEIEVPGEMAVMAVDNDEVICEMSTPSLTSIALNTELLGFRAAGLLDRLMRGKPAPKEPIAIEPLGVVARESTDMLALDDADVATAVRYIRANHHKPIHVTDVLETVPVSRKTLETRFQRVFGRTPHAELQRLRLDRVKQLLVQTNWPMKDVASASGYVYAEHMHTVFRNHFGMTPTEYRDSQTAG
ncbi:MAG: helix-turn-helix domain-containing protein [Phycisphaera sp.]|nr:helix-turn-helix domain-containing protein [Phycisphaera sp.]